MPRCICIDDTGRPETMPLSKWVKAGKVYTVIYSVTVLPQRELAFQLEEIDLDESCYPYEYFLASRFAFNQEEFSKLVELVQDSEQLDISLGELMSQTTLIGA
jgi:hypothetical protein